MCPLFACDMSFWLTKSLFSCGKVFGLNYSMLLHINPAQWGKKQSFPACLNRASGPFQYCLIPNVAN